MSETSAETRRRAAHLMRERAMEATPGPWEHDDAEVIADQESVVDGLNPANAVHIAGMHPGVALALADWLDAEARDDDARAFLGEALGYEVRAGRADEGLKVARAYLGEVTA